MFWPLSSEMFWKKGRTEISQTGAKQVEDTDVNLEKQDFSYDKGLKTKTLVRHPPSCALPRGHHLPEWFGRVPVVVCGPRGGGGGGGKNIQRSIH